MFCTFTSALPAVCVLCPISLFFGSSLISCFPGMLLRYCVSDFEMVPIAHIITGILLLLLLLLLAAGRPGKRHLHTVQGSHPVSAVQPPTQSSD